MDNDNNYVIKITLTIKFVFRLFSYGIKEMFGNNTFGKHRKILRIPFKGALSFETSPHQILFNP